MAQEEWIRTAAVDAFVTYSGQTVKLVKFCRIPKNALTRTLIVVHTSSMATTTLTNRPRTSSWIKSIKYLADLPGYGSHVLVVFADQGAWVYRNVPSTLPGLLTAGQASTKGGKRQSIGATFHRLVKGRYEELYVKDQETIETLKAL